MVRLKIGMMENEAADVAASIKDIINRLRNCFTGADVREIFIVLLSQGEIMGE